MAEIIRIRIILKNILKSRAFVGMNTVLCVASLLAFSVPARADHAQCVADCSAVAGTARAQAYAIAAAEFLACLLVPPPLDLVCGGAVGAVLGTTLNNIDAT